MLGKRSVLRSLPLLIITWLAGCLPALTAVAQDATERIASGDGVDWVSGLLIPIIHATVWTGVGVTLFAISIWVMVKLSPFSVRKEIEEDQNTALGIIIGAIILGISIILAASIAG